MAINNMQQVVVPQKPKVIANERIFVYMPDASKDSKGIATYDERDFNVSNGKVSLKWPIKTLIEDLADPVNRPSLTKVLPDEFIKTNTIVKLINPYTLDEYESTTAEIKLNREHRDPFLKPDLVMLDDNDFIRLETLIDDKVYYKYKMKVNNPLEQPSLIRLNPAEFKVVDGKTSIEWPKANYNSYGVVKIGTNSKLKLDEDHNLVVTGFENVENRLFSSRRYDEFGPEMKNYFESRFSAIDTSIGSLKSFLGIYNTITEAENLYSPNSTLIGSSVYILETDSYWTVRDNNGWEWFDTEIQYLQDINHVDTTKYIHNWKNSLTEFIQDTDSNEIYWAGTKAEFEQLDIDNLPNNVLLVIEDEETVVSEFYVTESRMKQAGFDVASNNILVTTENFDSSILGKSVTLVPEGNTMKLRPLIYSPNKIMISDEFGVLSTADINIDNIIKKNTSLANNKLVVGDIGDSIKSFETGIIPNLPLTSDGIGGVKVHIMTPNRLVKTGSNGELLSSTFIDTNIIKSGNSANEVLLSPNQLLLSGLDNTITTWDGTVYEGAIIVSDGLGKIKARQHNAPNRLFVTGNNGQLTEIGSGDPGQLLASGGASNLPGWVDPPEQSNITLQAVRTTNPTLNEALSYTGGLMAVVLDSEPSELRDNCIYYIG